MGSLFDESLIIAGGTDGTPIGNTADALKVALAAVTVAQSPSSSSGTIGSLNADVEFDNSTVGYGSLGIQISGTWVGTITPAVTLDGTNWKDISVFRDSDGRFYSSMTANDIFSYPIGAIKKFRMKMSAYTSGTATVTFFATADRPMGNVVQVVQNTSAAGVSNSTRVPEISTEHQKIHEQKMWSMSEIFQLNTNGTRRYFLTPGSSTAHLVVSMNTDGLVTIKLYEDPTGVTTSQTFTSYNRARSSTASALMTIGLVSAYTTLGTGPIWQRRFGSSNGNPTGLQLQRGQEWDLPNGKTYIVEVTSGTNNNNLDIEFEFYEG
jgi:hypothetical protein